jgi:hypothetical protein
MSACPPSKNSNDDRKPIFFLDRGGGEREFDDAAFESACVPGAAVDVAVDHDGCHMERGAMEAVARLDAPAADVAVVGGAVDQDGCHMERAVPVSCF